MHHGEKKVMLFTKILTKFVKQASKGNYIHCSIIGPAFVIIEEIEEAPFFFRGEYNRFGTSPPPLEEIEEIVAVLSVLYCC
jgi:hypothetical protein